MPVVLNRAELAHFLAMATRELRDPAKSVFVLSASYVPSPLRHTEAVTSWYREGKLALDMALGPDDIERANPRSLWLAVDQDGPVIEDGKLHAFHIRKLGHGAWALSPSLNMPGIMHCFVVIHGVPDPAPWERTIFLATEAHGAYKGPDIESFTHGRGDAR